MAKMSFKAMKIRPKGAPRMSNYIRREWIPHFCSQGGTALTILAVALLATTTEAAEKKQAVKAAAKAAVKKPLAPQPPKSALLTEADWQKAPLTPLQPGE